MNEAKEAAEKEAAKEAADKVAKENLAIVAAEEREKAKDIVEAAKEAAERIEKANKETADLMAKQERMKVEATLGGETDAGTQEQTQEQKEIAETKEFLKGTGYEEQLFPTEPQKKPKV